MEYTRLGNTDISISKLCVGCMSFGKAGTMHDWTLDEKQSENVIAHALELGINFFDTANVYSAGTSEEYLGKVLKNLTSRDKVVIASKVYFNEGRLSKSAIHRIIPVVRSFLLDCFYQVNENSTSSGVSGFPISGSFLSSTES